MVVDNTKAVDNHDYFDKSNRFYLRLKDAFFENVSPGSKVPIYSEDKNEEVSTDDDEV
ncbi:hypothetical protein [Wolbachia endosymbiont of Encarsia formosa]|uniref:hypothetical protein n=1 Tax=Wolbachia endosymbiont of Encarsia formosa TaxID=77125 RepID=UPI0031BB40C8